MTGTEFKDLVNGVVTREKKRKMFLKKILRLVIGLWASIIAMGELIYWTTPNWWSIPLGITLVLSAVVCLISIIVISSTSSAD